MLAECKLKVLHVIAGLNVGGAEMMLKRLVEADASHIEDNIVVSLTSLGTLGEAMFRRGVRVHALGMSSVLHFPLVLWKLVRLIQLNQPRVVQTWMYHADLVGGLAARLAGSCRVVWGIRSTSIPHGALSVTFWLVRLCAILSHSVPHKIICNARSAREAHLKLGFADNKIVVVGNGYDFSALEKCASTRMSARAELGFKPTEIVIGVVGRFDPLKDYFNFIGAAAKLAARVANVKFLMVGRGLDWSNKTLSAWIKGAGLPAHVVLVGERMNVPFYFSAMDIFCLSSESEGFPNVVVEALGMGLPCVVTNAGDAADILGSTDYVAPVKDSDALCDALWRMCKLSGQAREGLGNLGAQRVRLNYDIQAIKRDYDRIYADLLN